MAEPTTPVLDRGAAVTRSLLGWGVVAGPCYLLVGIVLGWARPGFDFQRHALSLLMLGHLGWIQRVNFVLTAVMMVCAGIGMLRAIRNGRGLAIGSAVIIAGAALAASALCPPDPVNGFPYDAGQTAPTTSGVLHLLFGAVQFVAITAAAVAYSVWNARLGRRAHSVASGACALALLAAFAGGVSIAQQPTGIALIWLAVLCEWAWLATASAQIYRWSPHPLGVAAA